MKTTDVAEAIVATLPDALCVSSLGTATSALRLASGDAGHDPDRRPRRHGDRPRGGLRTGPGGAALRSEAQAIELANGTDYGLAAGVWTRDLSRAHRVAHRLRAGGTVWVNSYRVVTPNVPFGGVGSSGWGRESSLESVRTFTETKGPSGSSSTTCPAIPSGWADQPLRPLTVRNLHP